ncbi:hypothetical protein AB0D97_18430 [Streptomyces roseus]|uniref:hypothetical protein n=1 Tax=Streptomyces roseus TaxID=66430 RepID=UPI0033D4D737
MRRASRTDAGADAANRAAPALDAKALPADPALADPLRRTVARPAEAELRRRGGRAVSGVGPAALLGGQPVALGPLGTPALARHAGPPPPPRPNGR